MNLLLRPGLFQPRPYRPKFRITQGSSDDTVVTEDEEIVVVIVATTDRLEIA